MAGVGGAGHLFSSHRPLSGSMVAGNPAAKWPGTLAGFQGGGYCWEKQGWACSAPTGLKSCRPLPLVGNDQSEQRTSPHSSPNCHLRRGVDRG